MNVSFVADESSYLLITLIASGHLYTQDKGLEGKAGGYAQNQNSAAVSVEAFCASFKLLMRQKHKEPRGCWHQSGACITWPMMVFLHERFYLVWA